MHDNRLSKMENLQFLTNLRVLNLSQNQIKTIELPHAMKSLNEINIRKNFISEVKDLSHITSVQRLYLSYNLISSLAQIETAPSSIFELTLDNNPIEKTNNLLPSLKQSFQNLTYYN